MASEVTFADFFEFDMTEGVVKNRLTSGRAFFFGSSAWGAVRDDLKGTYGQLGSAMAGQMGQSYGRNLGKMGRKLNMDLRVFFETMVKLGSKTGWGILSLSGGDPLTGRARLKLENCPLLRGQGRSGRPRVRVLLWGHSRRCRRDHWHDTQRRRDGMHRGRV